MPEHPCVTTEDLDRIAWYAQQASQPPAQVIQIPEDASLIAWCADALTKTVGDTAYGVAVGTAEDIEDGEALLTALTGNGDQSLANANFYMLCHTAVPLLVAEIRRLWALTP